MSALLSAPSVPSVAQGVLNAASAGSAPGGSRPGGGWSPDPSPAPGPGQGAVSAPSAGGAGFGGYVALIALIALTIPALRRRMVLSPAGLGPAGFLSLLERPG
jgi:hypothetical protein